VIRHRGSADLKGTVDGKDRDTVDHPVVIVTQEDRVLSRSVTGGAGFSAALLHECAAPAPASLQKLAQAPLSSMPLSCDNGRCEKRHGRRSSAGAPLRPQAR